MTPRVVVHPMRLPSVANMREHHMAKARRAKSHREIGYLLVRSMGAWPPDIIGLVVTITRIAPRPLDSDNMVSAAKGLRDGIADAFGIDDRDPRVTWRYAQRRGAPKEQWVEIAVEEP